MHNITNSLNYYKMNEYKYIDCGGDKYSRLTMAVNYEKQEIYYYYGGAICGIENNIGKVKYTTYATNSAKTLIRNLRKGLLKGSIKLS